MGIRRPEQPPSMTFWFAEQMKCLYGLSSNMCPEISENRRERKGLGADCRLSGLREGRGRNHPGEKHLSMCICFKFDHSRLPLILVFGSEPRREVPSIILSKLRTYGFS